jgi:histone-lysine N-methyltransferase SETMAR
MDNARPHTAHLTQDFLADGPFEVLPHPPYSPDVAPSDFYLFGTMKSKLKGLNAKTLAQFS